MKTVDLRSDTVTKPTPAMREAMRTAEVGDDVFGEDPTVNALEQRAAEIVGKEAALFVPSGTMANQVAIAAHTEPGREVVCEANSHVMLYEMGTLARFSGCLARAIPSADGILSWERIAGTVRGPSNHFRGTGLIAIENTHNYAGGRVYPLAAIEEICENAARLDVPVHMDGARVFDAATALGADVRAITAPVDSLSFCLSKGLGAPVGSLVAGNQSFVDEARLVRKALGGGMRQAGVLAAAGLVALEQSPADLPAVHADAKFLAESLARVPGIGLDPSTVESNIIFFDIAGTGLSNAEFLGPLRESGVLALGLGPGRIRMVTHRDLDRGDCEQAVAAVERTCASASRAAA